MIGAESDLGSRIRTHNDSLVRHGKYVFDPKTVLPIRFGDRKPYQFLHAEAFCERFAHRSRMIRLDADLDSPAASASSFVVVIQNGWCHGRHCDWIGAEDCAIEDFRYLDGRLRANAFPLGRLNPRYWRRRLATPTRFPKPMNVAGRVVVLNKVASHNFYHWLSEVLPRYELFLRSGLQHADVYVADCQSAFQRRTLELLGVPLDRVIQPHNGLMLCADELVVPSFTSPEARRRTGRLLQASVDVSRSDAPPEGRKIYVSRRHSANRSLDNETEVAGFLESIGYETHYLERMTMDDQIRLFGDASVVVGLHGAGLTNAMLCRSSTHLIEIRPDDCPRECFAELACELRMPFHLVTARRRRRRGPIVCPIADLAEVCHGIGDRKAA